MLTSGQTIGTYQVGETLGAGGFATVYRARHTLLSGDHAIKVLSAEFAAKRELRDRFLAEGKILARLRHPAIVRVSDVLIQPGVAGLVMDFEEGETLEAALTRLPGAWSLRLVGQLMTQLVDVDAVAAAHHVGVIHRDLKPANIILRRNGTQEVDPVLLDFGIAKLTDDLAATRRAVTRTSMRMGTVGYMSPEQVRSARDVTDRSDTFSLGCILYELATGQQAFAFESEFDTMRAIVDGTLDRDAVPPRLRGLVGQMLSQRPDDRPSAPSVAEALTELLPSELNDLQSKVAAARKREAQLLEDNRNLRRDVDRLSATVHTLRSAQTPVSNTTSPSPAEPPTELVPAVIQPKPAARTAATPDNRVRVVYRIGSGEYPGFVESWDQTEAFVRFDANPGLLQHVDRASLEVLSLPKND